MSDEAMLPRYLGKLPGADQSGEPEPSEDCRAFGWLRGTRDRALMLELRRKDGSITAVGYAWLERAEFDPSEGITLCFAGSKIRIKGRNLNSESRPNVRLFEGITRHRVPWVQEAGRGKAMESGEADTVIDAIEW